MTHSTIWPQTLEAGNVLASRQGRIGFLTRELSAELPALMERAARR